MSIADAYNLYDAVGLAQLVRSGQVTPAELLDEAIRRAEALNPQLNAVVIKMYDEARARVGLGIPDGPLAGVPLLLEDLVNDYAGAPRRGASRAFSDFISTQHDEVVSRYLAAGAIIFGRTNTSEWGILPTVESELYGACRNPWDLERTTGGSSGGAAAAVAARIVPAAHGCDGGGSIRIPASCCGVFGFKPSRGRVPFGPNESEVSHGLVAQHALTLTVRDSAAILDVLAGADDSAPYCAPPSANPFSSEADIHPGQLKIGFTSTPILPGVEDADCRDAVYDAVELLRSLGHEVFEVKPPVDGARAARALFQVYCGSVAGEIDYAKRNGQEIKASDVESTTWLMALIGKHILDAGALSGAIRELQSFARAMSRFHRSFDLLLTPTLGKPPVELGTLGARGFEKRVQEEVARHSLYPALRFPGVLARAIARAYEFTPYAPIANITGQPAMSVPLYWAPESGLPIGVAFTGRYGDEAALFRLARQLELARPWNIRRPPVCAE